MASKYFKGTASAVQMVDRFTPANVEITDIFVLTATGEDGTTAAVSFTATAATVANVTAGLTAAWNASTHPFHTGITAADATTSMTLTADTAGVPFSVASSATDGGGANTQTLTRLAVTANSGPGDWNVAANWSDGAAPVTSDNVVLDPRMASDIPYGLNQAGVTLASLKTYRGAKAVGTAYAALRISATAQDFNLPPEDGSSPSAAFFNINNGTAQATANIHGSANSGSNGLEPVLWDGTHASNAVNVYGGTVGIGTMTPGDTATVLTLNVIGNTAKAVVASGVTLGTVNAEKGGKAVIRCATATAINSKDAACSITLEGSGTHALINTAGQLIENGTGTITELHVESGGSLDTTQTNLARTISACFVYGTGKVETDLNTTYTAGIDCLRGAKSSQVNFGDNVTITPSAT